MANTEKFNNICMKCMKPKNENEICSNCNFDESDYNIRNQLKLRTMLCDCYIVGEQTEENGEGISYIGFDTEHERIVSIKEFMPGNLCQRDKDGEKIIVIPGCEISFRENLDEFLNLFKNLMRLKDSKALLKVYDVFEENCTAYAVFEWVESMSLQEFVKIGKKRLDWNTARPLFMPILSLLIEINKIGINHLAVNPENVVVSRSGEMKLKGFAVPAIRQISTDLVPELYLGCSAIEQYISGSHLGEHTDVYAFSATLFFVLTGILPDGAVKRQTDDRLLLPKSILKTIPVNILTTLAEGLQVIPSKRIQSLKVLMDRLSVTPKITLSEYDDKFVKPKKKKQMNKRNTKVVLISFVITLVVCVLAFLFVFMGSESMFGNSDTSKVSSEPVITVSPANSQLNSDMYFAVPNLVGKDMNEIQEESRGMYEVVKSGEEYNDNVEEGKVISQSPSSGDSNSKFTVGSIISVVISKGSKFRPLPDIKGLTLAEACQQITKAGFVPHKLSDVQRDEVGNNETIEYKDHSAGDLVEVGSTVEIVLIKK